MMEEDREYENQRGWREPTLVKKTAGADPEFTFVYPDGTEITMDSMGSRTAPSEFCTKYASKFNFLPNMSRDEWVDTVNDWLAEVRVVEVNPLSAEGRAREKVQQMLQTAHAVPEKDDLAAVDGAITYQDDGSVILCPTDDVASISEDLEASLRQVSEYLEPIVAGPTTRLRVRGKRWSFWQFDADAIRENGYSLPEVKGLPDEADGPDGETAEEVSDL
jgi:hypothetical protein